MTDPISRQNESEAKRTNFDCAHPPATGIQASSSVEIHPLHDFAHLLIKESTKKQSTLQTVDQRWKYTLILGRDAE
jgi:hypothetical protein